MEFKTKGDSQTWKKINFLILDNGGEYNSNHFDDLCNDVGIKRKFVVLYNQRKNDVAERKNRSVIGTTNSMIHDQYLSMFLWEEAFHAVVYIQ